MDLKINKREFTHHEKFPCYHEYLFNLNDFYLQLPPLNSYILHKNDKKVTVQSLVLMHG